ncbi:signal-regulatory protein beta-2-like [Osmerus mordax]|uniref:signal-regulatory protein beta-2-like n=1 Tax=Osmerus mordax TaxID=8014 RepID=UPI00351080AE
MFVYEKIPVQFDPQLHICFVYNLPKRNLSLYDAGTYYCAVASFCTLNEDIIVQPDHVMVVREGESVNLTCLRTYNKAVLWFKQIIGQKPVLIVTSYVHSFILNIKNLKPEHLNVSRGVNSCNLTITQTQLEDSATYYCALTSIGITFGDGTLLIVKEFEPKSRTIVQHSVSESHKPGDSVTLNCTIHTETCSGEHNVYWFTHGSGESRPGILYTHGGRSDQCEKSPEAGSPTQSYVYNLPKRNLSLSDAGTYYCAVASCGEILFGNGIKQDIQEGTDTSDCQTEYRSASVSRTNEQVSDDVDLNYSTLKFTDKKKTKTRRQKENPIYTEVR